MAKAIAPGMAFAMRVVTVLIHGKRMAQAKPSHYVGWLGLWLSVVTSQNQVQTAPREFWSWR
jgi:hypothetical protein